MTGYIAVVRFNTPDGKPQIDAFKTDDDKKILSILAICEEPTPVPPPVLKQIQVVVSGLHLRGGANVTAFVIRDLAVGEIFTVYETITDANGYEWCRVGDNQWLCRFIPGGNPPEKAKWL